MEYNIDELKDLINNSGAYFQNWYDNEFYYKELFNFSGSNKLNKSYKELSNWELSDFTQKINPSSGKFNFILRKRKKFENRFFKIEEITRSTIARKMPFKKLEIKDFNDSASLSDNIENVILTSLDAKLSVVLEKSNKLIYEKYPSKKISFEDLRDLIHKYWKAGFITLADH